MKQIKSEEAKERIEYYSDGMDFIYPLTKEQIVEVVAIAERQAEKRHAKELRELKERVVKAFCFGGICKNISAQVEESESCPFIIECDDRKLFIEKLSEK